jgi:hypothetical protein
VPDLVGLTTTDSDDDFQSIGIGQVDLRMLASGHDFAVAFNRYALAGKVKLEKKFSNAQGGGKLALLAVDAEGDHFVVPAKSSRILAREFTTRV